MNKRGVVRQSGLTSLAAAASVVSGLLLDAAIAADFGAGRAADAFFVAARLPLGLVAIVMVAANQALVPAISTWLVREGERATWRLVSMLLTATMALAGALVLVAGLAAPLLSRLIAPGLSSAQLDLAASMARVMFVIVPLVALAEVLRALLNARYSFVAPAAMHVVMNGVAAGLVLASPGRDIKFVAWAYVAGAGAQLAFIALIAWRRGFRYRPELSLRDPGLSSVGRLTVRPLAAAGLNPVARIGEQVVVSFLPSGSISILNYGYRLISAIGGSVFFRSVIVTLVPRLTEAHARGDDEEFSRITLLGVRLMLVVSIPLTAFMAVLAGPLAIAIFRRGSFDRDSANLLGAVLAVYAASLVGSAVQRALLAPFFARLDTRTPLRNTAWGVAANLLLLPLLVLPFGDGDDRGVLGVAAAYSLAQYVNVVHAVSKLRRSNGPRTAAVGPLAARLVLASALAAAAMAWAHAALDLGGSLSRGALVARAALAGGIGLIVLLALLAALSGPEIRHLWLGLRSGRRRAP